MRADIHVCGCGQRRATVMIMTLVAGRAQAWRPSCIVCLPDRRDMCVFGGTERLKGSCLSCGGLGGDRSASHIPCAACQGSGLTPGVRAKRGEDRAPCSSCCERPARFRRLTPDGRPTGYLCVECVASDEVTGVAVRLRECLSCRGICDTDVDICGRCVTVEVEEVRHAA